MDQLEQRIKDYGNELALQFYGVEIKSKNLIKNLRQERDSKFECGLQVMENRLGFFQGKCNDQLKEKKQQSQLQQLHE